MSDNHTLGDAPIEDRHRLMLNTLAMSLDLLFNDGKKGDKRDTGFVLMVFPFGDHDGRCNYISNGADREDIVTLMKEMIARFEGQPEVSGTA
jgi:hypothetical protein